MLIDDLLAVLEAAPPCNWHGGCHERATTGGLCPFHADACERLEHAARQEAFETAAGVEEFFLAPGVP